MLPTVFIVDEEYHFAQNVASALRFEGYQAFVLPDATVALRYFTKHYSQLEATVSCFLVDVALSGGEDKELFSIKATDEYHRTGIVLMKYLVERCPKLFRADNTVLYTAHFRTILWDQIEEYCSRNKFRSWQKLPVSNVDDIVQLVKDMIPSRSTGDVGHD